MATPRKSFRLTEADMEIIKRLGKLWGGRYKPLEDTEVVRVAVRKCLEAESAAGPGEKTRKKSKKGLDVS